jgi:hypothetical protein
MGIPFMKANSALDVIIDDLENLRFSFLESVAYRLPAAYLFAHESDLAVKYVNERLTALGQRQDEAALRYKGFWGDRTSTGPVELDLNFSVCSRPSL